MTTANERLPRYYQPNYQGRPLEYLVDRDGGCWLCDKHTNPWRDPRAQGCWRCEEMAFPQGGR